MLWQWVGLPALDLPLGSAETLEWSASSLFTNQLDNLSNLLIDYKFATWPIINLYLLFFAGKVVCPPFAHRREPNVNR